MEINRTLGDRTRKLKQQKIGAGPIETAEELVGISKGTLNIIY